MPRSNCTALDTGDYFPAMEFSAVGGGTVTLPRDFSESWNVLLFYRGHW